MCKSLLDSCAARAVATLADLSDRYVMSADICKAHRALDLAVDKFYCAQPFTSGRETVERLFGLYEFKGP